MPEHDRKEVVSEARRIVKRDEWLIKLHTIKIILGNLPVEMPKRAAATTQPKESQQ